MEWPALHRAAWAVLGDAHEAQDAVEEALLRALNVIGQLHDTGAFHAWLRRIAVNEARDRLRALFRQRAREQADPGLHRLGDPLGADPGHVVEARAGAERLLRAVQRLAPRERQVFLAVARGESPAEVAVRQGLQPGAVRAALHRGRSALETWLPEVREVREGRRVHLTRAQLARRLRAIGLELRAAADVVEIGQAQVTPRGEVVLEHLVHDAGILLVLWRATSRDASRRLELAGALRNGAAADAQRYALVRHPGPDRRQRLAWHEWMRGPAMGPPQWQSDVAVFEIDVPAWDGGLDLVPARISDALISVQNSDYGGLGGLRGSAVRQPARLCGRPPPSGGGCVSVGRSGPRCHGVPPPRGLPGSSGMAGRRL